MSSNKYNGDDVITQFARLIKSGPFTAS